MTDVHYEVAGATLERFFADDSFVRVLVGPFGSGKTAACCAEAFRRCQEQAPDADGVRRSKGVVIRSTYRQLQTTTAPSWRGWFGAGCPSRNTHTAPSLRWAMPRASRSLTTPPSRS